MFPNRPTPVSSHGDDGNNIPANNGLVYAKIWLAISYTVHTF